MAYSSDKSFPNQIQHIEVLTTRAKNTFNTFKATSARFSLATGAKL